MHIHLTEKRKFLIVPRFPEGVAKDWRIPLGDQNLEVTTDLVVRKLQSASRGRFSNLNLSWHEAILLPYGFYDNCRISNAILVGGEYSKCNMKYTRLVVEGRRESRKAPAPAQGAGGPPRRQDRHDVGRRHPQGTGGPRRPVARRGRVKIGDASAP